MSTDTEVALPGTTVTVAGAELYYEQTGTGPALIAVPGLGSGAHTYRKVAEHLADRFRFLGYDRRGSLHSTGRVDAELDMARQSADIAAVLDAAEAPSATILTNCAGASIAFDFLTRYPHRVDALVAHEPATLYVLDDAEQQMSVIRTMVELNRKRGPVDAMLYWLEVMGYDFTRPLGDTFFERTRADGPHQYANELLPLANYMPSFPALTSSAVPLAMAVGVESSPDIWFGRTAEVLADRLGCRLARFPGGHIGHLTRPEEFACALAETVGELLEHD